MRSCWLSVLLAPWLAHLGDTYTHAGYPLKTAITPPWADTACARARPPSAESGQASNVRYDEAWAVGEGLNLPIASN